MRYPEIAADTAVATTERLDSESTRERAERGGYNSDGWTE